ncbi:hypothetical protein QL285_018112 [Trifolium repens]|nr:hypothetical protein QL285_018112 [Trifolium repens]
MFLVSDNLNILPSSKVNSLMMLLELGCSDLTQLEEVTHNIGKQEILNLLKYTLTSHEPLTNTLLASSSKILYYPPNQSASALRKIFWEPTLLLDVLVMYTSVENLEPTSVLLNPGIAPQFGCPNQPLNIPHAELPTYYYDKNSRGVTSKSPSVAPHYGLGRFVKRTTLYDVGDDLKVKPLSHNICLSYLKELNLPIDDLKVKLITIGDDEMLNLLKYTLTSHEPLTNTILASSSKIKHNTPNQFASAVREMPCTSSNSKMDIKVIQSTIVKLLGPNSFARCVGNLYKSVENLEPTSVLLDPGLSLAFDDLEVKVISIGEAEALSLLGAFLTSKFTLNSGLQDFLNVPKQESTFNGN